jgi:ABC-type phosphate/phosphonate transport system ATPase subunit
MSKKPKKSEGVFKMINVFYGQKGAGKSKSLLKLANERIDEAKGNVVYIDDDKRPMLELNRKIRFISTDNFDLKDYKNFYGFLCGILSEDYDIEAMFIDGLFNIVEGEEKDAALLFYNMEKLVQKYKLDFYINLNLDSIEVPEYLKKYVA